MRPFHIQLPRLAPFASLLLALIFAAIGAWYWHDKQNELDQELARESEVLRTAFDVSMYDLEQQMRVLATMVAADTTVQTLYYRGKRTLETEGGGAGGPRTAQLRTALYQHVAPAWSDMQRQFGLRQLHFQLGPGALSYLRVHTPEKFGDRMDGLRHIIEDVNRDQQPRTGFETGRIYSGIRGVVPVWHTDEAGTRRYLGALEAGSSFDTRLAQLDGQFGAGFAVLLRKEHVEDAVWDQYRGLSGPQSDQGCRCYLEASSRPQVNDWMNGKILPPLTDQHHTVSRLLPWQGRIWHLTRFPLHDYLGKTDPSRPAVGSILIWRDKSTEVAAWKRQRLNGLLGLALAYLLTQGVLVWLLYTTRRTLQLRIDQATSALTVARERLDLALQGADLGLWDWHIPSGNVTFNARWAEMLGYSLDEIAPHVSSWEQLVHPDDQAVIHAALEPHLQGATQFYESEHRMRHKDGHWVWVLDRGKVMERAKDGTPLRAVGTHLDISARKAADTRLRENEAVLQRAQAVAHVGSWTLDVASGNIAWSAETYHIFDVTPDTPVSYDLFLSFIHPDDRQPVDEAWQAALAGAPYDIEHRIVVNEEIRWVREMADLTTDGKGELVAALGTVQDITRFKVMEMELRRLATTDTLTGLPNRRYFLGRLTDELARYQRFGKPVALLMLDIDHFKLVNDQHGHAGGDAVLRHFASTALATLRKIDLIGRLGGEEFAILLPGTDLAGAHLYAERLRTAVATQPCQSDDATISFTVSMGLTLFNRSDENMDRILARADAALYRAKENGRNRVETG